MLEGPIGWTDAVGGVVNAVVDVEMNVVGLEDDGGGSVELVGQEVEVAGAGEFVDLKASPD